MAKPPADPGRLDKDALKHAVLEKLRADVNAVEATAMQIVDGKVQLGAIVDVQDEDGRRVRYFILPAGQGMHVGKTVSAAQVVTHESVVGKALLGHAAGDVVSIPSKDSVRRTTILAVI